METRLYLGSLLDCCSGRLRWSAAN